MKLTVLAASALIALSTVTSLNAQTARDFAQPGVRAGLETEIDQSMSKMLGQAKERLIASEGPEIILPFICPHAMRVLAGIAAGKVDMGTGARLFLFGLDMDRNEMMGMKVGGFPGVDLTGADARLSVSLARGVSRKDLAGVIELGEAYLK